LRWRSPTGTIERFDTVASALVTLADSHPRPDIAPFPETSGTPIRDFYARGELFHGPAFQVLREARRDGDGAEGWLDTSESSVPRGTLQPVLLDGALQVIPHDRLDQWGLALGKDTIGYPHHVTSLRTFGPTPALGEARTRVRFAGALDAHRVAFDVHILSGDTLWATMRLVEVLMPKGPLGRAEAMARTQFLRDRVAVDGVGLSARQGDETHLAWADVQASNWFRGTLSTVYDVAPSATSAVLAQTIAIKEHIASSAGVHPAAVTVSDDLRAATLPTHPLRRQEVEVANEEGVLRVSSRGPVSVDLAPIKTYWQRAIGAAPGWFGDDLYGGLISRFVRDVVVHSPDEMARLRGRSVLFIGNHEVQIESLLITAITSWLVDGVVVTMANAKHEARWVGWLVRHLFAYPGVEDPKNIVYFDQSNPKMMFDLIEGFKRDVAARGASVMVHGPGTRARQAGARVERVGSPLLDMALELDMPIVPVCFSGGLPDETIQGGKLEFPWQQGAQTYHLGAPVWPDTLRQMPYAERRPHVMNAINSLMPALASAPDTWRSEATAAIAALQREHAIGEVQATLWHMLTTLQAPGPDAVAIVNALDGQSTAATPRGRWIQAMAAWLSAPDR